VLVISVRIQISPNQNLSRERHRFFRTGATIFLDPAPLRISHSEAGRAQNERRVDDPVNDRPISCLLRLQRDSNASGRRLTRSDERSLLKFLP
jgi:hypothetical protein